MARREPERQAIPPGRADETQPVRVASSAPPVVDDFDDDSGILPRGARPHVPMARAPHTPPLGVQLDRRTPPLGMGRPTPPVGIDRPAPRSFVPADRDTPPLGLELEPLTPPMGVPVVDTPPLGIPRPRGDRPTPSVGFRPPSSRPPAGRDRRTPPVGDLVREERVRPSEIDALASARPDAAPRVSDADARARAQRIIETLRSCGPDDEGPAVAALKKLGPVALEPMEREFPGLLWFHRRVAHKRLPRGRDVGSLARAIVAFGEDSVPLLRRILENGDIDQRFYAVLVAGDVLPRCRENNRAALLESLGRRLRDVDQSVSDCAVHVLMAYREDDAIRPMVGNFVIQMADLAAPPADRLFAVRVLGVLRSVHALGAFVERLDDPSEHVRDAARKALRLLTAEDLGSSRRKWAAWVRKHGAQRRVRWLIEGLIHRDEELRAMAVRELEKATARDFGFRAGMGRGDRKRCYREAVAWFDREYAS